MSNFIAVKWSTETAYNFARGRVDLGRQPAVQKIYIRDHSVASLSDRIEAALEIRENEWLEVKIIFGSTINLQSVFIFVLKRKARMNELGG